MAPREAYGKLVEALSERGELAAEELPGLTGLGGAELDGALGVLEALGFIEREEGLVRWRGPEIRGRVVIIRGKVDYVLQSPLEVRVFGLETLKATVKP